ncbi:MAG: A24 family peptidase [Candidatus Marinimicrobia bacterium]|nr:A24 family peptidase [Candidatus Neomarinimicrobiota bacterium]
MLLKVILGIVISLLVTGGLHHLIYALPLNKIPFKTPLHCSSCHNRFSGIMRIPFFGSLLTIGRCPECHQRLSNTYLTLEFLSPPLVLIMIIFLEPIIALELILAYSALVTIALIDMEHWIIPNKLLFVILAAGFLRVSRSWDQLWFQLSGALPMLILLGMIILIQLVYIKKPGLGMGDLKLAMVLGVWLGPLLAMYTMFVATLLTLLLWVFQGIWGGYKLQRAIQFGPFIALSAMVFGIGRALDPQITTHLLTFRF